MEGGGEETFRRTRSRAAWGSPLNCPPNFSCQWLGGGRPLGEKERSSGISSPAFFRKSALPLLSVAPFAAKGEGAPPSSGKARPLLFLAGETQLFFPCMYSSMAVAAFLPAPMARMTVAAPVTASPPA